MGFFKKLFGVSKRRNLVDATVLPEISNDELVAAYEWGALSNGDAPHFPSHARILAKIRGCPDSVITTLHNLGVAE